MSRRIVEAAASYLARRTTRRSFLSRTAVVGAALAADPVTFILRPVSAYASVCGSGASCASGWTAFCVTVNHGVNQCPPGSFSAGWWKADHASVCGGGARYYVDCNASCIDGRRGHYSCSCRCAPGHTCDKRHTCCNQFRYGQCHQDIHCYGPVVCRVVSCVPPWKWAHCSTSAATDNRTLSHSAPELPHHWDAIEKRYVKLHGHASRLGASVGRRHEIGHGLLQNYQHGLLAWSRHTPAAMLLTGMAEAYHRLGGPGGRLGFPLHDQREARSGHGRIARFTHGALFVHGEDTAHAFHGPLFSRWTDLADTAMPLGQPTSNARATADGSGQIAEFRHGVLMWSSSTGAHTVWGLAARRYDKLRRHHSYLGYPVADTQPTDDGRGFISRFRGGAIVATPDGAARDMNATLLAYWTERGSVTGPLGYPTSEAQPLGAGNAAQTWFEGGVVFTGGASGCHAVMPPILATYESVGGASGRLGMPTGDLEPTGKTTSTQSFQGGTITYDASDGSCTVTYTDGTGADG